MLKLYYGYDILANQKRFW